VNFPVGLTNGGKAGRVRLQEVGGMLLSIFGVEAAAQERELPRVIPDEAALLQALRTAYRNPTTTTTKAMHEDVSARHPNWTVNVKRVRKLLCRVAAEDACGDACGEEEGWCVIRTPGVATTAAVSVSQLWAARRRGAS
jgi:hypothetical protein